MNVQVHSSLFPSQAGSLHSSLFKNDGAGGQHPVAQLGAYEQVAPQTTQLAFGNNNRRVQ